MTREAARPLRRYGARGRAASLPAQPTIFSHSNPRALREHPRNIRDDQIRACAQKGGVVGVNGVNSFLGVSDPTPESLLPHIDYVAELVGVEHVGLGLDYVHDLSEIPILFKKHPGAWPGYSLEDMTSSRFMAPEGLPRLTELLLERGYDETGVRGILGENFLRVAAQAWQPWLCKERH